MCVYLGGAPVKRTVEQSAAYGAGAPQISPLRARSFAAGGIAPRSGSTYSNPRAPFYRRRWRYVWIGAERGLGGRDSLRSLGSYPLLVVGSRRGTHSSPRHLEGGQHRRADRPVAVGAGRPRVAHRERPVRAIRSLGAWESVGRRPRRLTGRPPESRASGASCSRFSTRLFDDGHASRAEEGRPE
jgi:hypothetical protein